MGVLSNRASGLMWNTSPLPPCRQLVAHMKEYFGDDAMVSGAVANVHKHEVALWCSICLMVLTVRMQGRKKAFYFLPGAWQSQVISI